MLGTTLAHLCQVLAMPEYCFNQSKLATRIMKSDAGFLYILNNSNRKHLNSLLFHCLQRARALKLPHIEAFACVEMMKQKLLCSPGSPKAAKEMEEIGKLLDEILYVVNNESAETDCGGAALEDLGLDLMVMVLRQRRLVALILFYARTAFRLGCEVELFQDLKALQTHLRRLAHGIPIPPNQLVHEGLI